MKEDNSRKKKLILPLFIGLIMVLSIIGFAFTNSPDTYAGDFTSSYTYNGHEYVSSQNGWATAFGEGYIVFTYGPRELESIKLPDFNFGNKVYISYDPDEKSSNVDTMIQKISSIFVYSNIRAVTACQKDSPNCPNIPIASCDSNDKVITISEQESMEIAVEGSCLHLKGTASDLNRITDKLAMQLLGLI